MTATSANPKLLRAYKRVLLNFNQIWAIKRHYEMLAIEFGDEELMNAPIDLNRVYGTLKVLFEMVQKSDSPALVSRLEATAKDLVATFEWFKSLDERITPYDLRVYLEHSADNDAPQLRAFARYFLNKQQPSADDLAKADYLLARAFSWIVEDGHVRLTVENEDQLETQIARLLPRKYRRARPQGYLQAITTLTDYLVHLTEFTSYDELIASNLIATARQFKNELGDCYYCAPVLAKCVLLNVAMRGRFQYFCAEQHERIKNFSRTLVGSGAELVQNAIDVRQNLSLDSALEFAEYGSELLTADYTNNLPYLERISRLHDMLQRTMVVHGLDPHGTVAPAGVAAMADALTEQQKGGEEPAITADFADEGLRARLDSLSVMIRGIKTPPRPSAVKVLNLEHGTLVLSSWEFDAFKPAPSDNYFARQSYDVIKRSVALIAEIQENIALYREHQEMPQLANAYLMKVNFYVVQAQTIVEELDQQSQQARDRHDIDAACNLSATRQKVLDSYRRLTSMFGQQPDR